MHARYEIRRAIQIPVELVSAEWDETVTLRTSDLSPRGCFLPTQVLLDPGTPLVVSFRLGKDGTDWTLFGEVARVCSGRRRSDPDRPGVGLRFVGLTPMDRLRLRERLRGVPPPLPKPPFLVLN